jgi:hypothetical protein
MEWAAKGKRAPSRHPIYERKPAMRRDRHHPAILRFITHFAAANKSIANSPNCQRSGVVLAQSKLTVTVFHSV